jgi:hypothetical protein
MRWSKTEAVARYFFLFQGVITADDVFNAEKGSIAKAKDLISGKDISLIANISRPEASALSLLTRYWYN